MDVPVNTMDVTVGAVSSINTVGAVNAVVLVDAGGLVDTVRPGVSSTP